MQHLNSECLVTSMMKISCCWELTLFISRFGFGFVWLDKCLRFHFNDFLKNCCLGRFSYVSAEFEVSELQDNFFRRENTQITTDSCLSSSSSSSCYIFVASFCCCSQLTACCAFLIVDGTFLVTVSRGLVFWHCQLIIFCHDLNSLLIIFHWESQLTENKPRA